MRGTDYWRVSRTNQEAEVRVWPDQSGEQEPFFVDDDPEWHALLSDIGVLQVAQQDGAVSMGSGSLWRNPGPLENAPDERFGFSDITHDPNMLDRVVLCAPEHEEIPCGRCAVPLSDDWYQDHSWWPLFYDQERSDAFHDGEMDLETYSELEAEDRLRCMIDGYTEMGYDVERLFDLDPTD